MNEAEKIHRDQRAIDRLILGGRDKIQDRFLLSQFEEIKIRTGSQGAYMRLGEYLQRDQSVGDKTGNGLFSPSGQSLPLVLQERIILGAPRNPRVQCFSIAAEVGQYMIQVVGRIEMVWFPRQTL